MSPSLRDDYIMRLIEKTAKAVAQMIGHRQAGDFTAAHAVLDAAYRSLLGSDAVLFSRMDVETGVRLLVEPEKMAVMADLLHEDAELARAAREGDGLEMDRKALEYARKAAEARPEDEDFKVLAVKMEEVERVQGSKFKVKNSPGKA
jgi:hypothetical protein